MTRFFLSAALVLLAPITSHAQDKSALPGTLSASTRASIERLMDSLSRERLPAHALRDKAREGVLKGADDTRVLLAVRALAHRLRDARVALGPTAEDNELLAAASALFAGVPVETIRALAQTERARTRAGALIAPLTVLAELAASKLPVDAAAASVATLLERGAADADFSAFRQSVHRYIRNGRVGADALREGEKEILSRIRGI